MARRDVPVQERLLAAAERLRILDALRASALEGVEATDTHAPEWEAVTESLHAISEAQRLAEKAVVALARVKVPT